jgi:ribosomal protein L7/L12
MTSFPCEYCSATIPVQNKTLKDCPSCGNPCWPAEVKAWVRAGMKINAIKVYRFMTNVGLKEAKDAVEDLQRKGFLYIPEGLNLAAAPAANATPPTPTKTDSPSLEQELLALIKQQGLIQAIKLYRERTGVGLKEAKDAVEALRDGKPFTLHTNAASQPPPPPAEPDVRTRILALVQQGLYIEAIKLYREKTGLGLRESKDAIDAVRAGQPLSLSMISSSQKAASPEPNHDNEVLLAIKQGNKITAVKIYREQTGLGLRESLDAVEAIIRGEKRPPFFGEALAAPQASAAPKPDPNEPFRAELLSVLQNEGFINAIRLYRDKTGVGLKEGKDFIEALEQDPNAPFPLV